MSENETSSVKSLYTQVKALNGSNGHMVMKGIYHDNKATAVISVYNDVKPSHMVLDELWDWIDNTEANNELDAEVRMLLMDKIRYIEDDLTFMND
ncbi:hypothetical protein [Sporolactobacillus terrae]|uniref:hypothetical protein n=1 Tax=Sporolactobacillus terrae TaxID=269673 RepID=UPI00048D6DFD|nr:hypothetical protein [Sporolactobacillus terrae]